MAYLEVNNLSRISRGKPLLDKISFSVDQGAITGIIGPSGSGKTSLIKAVIGIDKCSEGTILLENTPMPNHHKLKKIGYMAQTDSLYPYLNAEQHMGYYADLYHIPRKKYLKQTAELLAAVDLRQAENRNISTYTADMKRRLSLAIALLHAPSLILLDEPTAGIDPIYNERVWQLLRHLADFGAAILIATSSPEEAGKCDRLLLLEKGKMFAEGTPSSLTDAARQRELENAFSYLGRSKS